VEVRALVSVAIARPDAMGRRLPARLALALALAWPGGSSAQADEPGEPVVLLSAQPDAMVELTARLQGELASSGFTVRLMAPPPDEGALGAGLRASGAGAWVVVEPSALAIWIEPARPRVRRLELPGDEEDVALLAIRCVEVVRAAALSFRAPPPPAPAVAGPRLVLELAATALFGDGALTAALGPSLRVGLALDSTWALYLRSDGPLFGVTGAVEAGLVDHRQWLGRLGVLASFGGLGPFVPFVQLDVGAWYIAAEGRPDAPAVGSTAEAWALAIAGGAGARVHVTDLFAVTVEGALLVGLPRFVVRASGAPIGTAGGPSGTLSVGLFLRLP
jgi:hypothetical protein